MEIGILLFKFWLWPVAGRIESRLITSTAVTSDVSFNIRVIFRFRDLSNGFRSAEL